MNNKILAKIADEPFSFELFIENQKFSHVWAKKWNFRYFAEKLWTLLKKSA